MAVGSGSQWFGCGMGGLGDSVGMWSSRYGGFADVAGFRDLAGFGKLGLQLWNRILEDVLLYGSDLLSGHAVPFALGLYVVTSWGGHSVDDGTGDACIFCQE